MISGTTPQPIHARNFDLEAEIGARIYGRTVAWRYWLKDRLDRIDDQFIGISLAADEFTELIAEQECPIDEAAFLPVTDGSSSTMNLTRGRPAPRPANIAVSRGWSMAIRGCGLWTSRLRR